MTLGQTPAIGHITLRARTPTEETESNGGIVTASGPMPSSASGLDRRTASRRSGRRAFLVLLFMLGVWALLIALAGRAEADTTAADSGAGEAVSTTSTPSKDTPSEGARNGASEGEEGRTPEGTAPEAEKNSRSGGEEHASSEGAQNGASEGEESPALKGTEASPSLSMSAAVHPGAAVAVSTASTPSKDTVPEVEKDSRSGGEEGAAPEAVKNWRSGGEESRASTGTAPEAERNSRSGGEEDASSEGEQNGASDGEESPAPKGTEASPSPSMSAAANPGAAVADSTPSTPPTIPTSRMASGTPLLGPPPAVAGERDSADLRRAEPTYRTAEAPQGSGQPAPAAPADAQVPQPGPIEPTPTPVTPSGSSVGQISCTSTGSAGSSRASGTPPAVLAAHCAVPLHGLAVDVLSSATERVLSAAEGPGPRPD
jgi:hypothetical protein